MLTNVPSGVNRMARNVIMNHPNTFSCQAFRKKVTRAGDLSGGMPKLGGLGVMSSEDEEQIEWEHLGNAYAMQAEMFSPSYLSDRMDANNNSDGQEFRFVIEPEANAGEAGWFQPKKNDIILIMLGDDVRIAYEIAQVETAVNIPPYVSRYVVNRRGDLDIFSSLDAPPGSDGDEGGEGAA